MDITEQEADYTKHAIEGYIKQNHVHKSERKVLKSIYDKLGDVENNSNTEEDKDQTENKEIEVTEDLVKETIRSMDKNPTRTEITKEIYDDINVPDNIHFSSSTEYRKVYNIVNKLRNKGIVKKATPEKSINVQWKLTNPKVESFREMSKDERVEEVEQYIMEKKSGSGIELARDYFDEESLTPNQGIYSMFIQALNKSDIISKERQGNGCRYFLQEDWDKLSAEDKRKALKVHLNPENYNF